MVVEERLDFIETRRRADVVKQISNVVLLTSAEALDQAHQRLSVILETVDLSLQIELSALVALDIDDAFLVRLDARFTWGYATTLQPLSRAVAPQGGWRGPYLQLARFARSTCRAYISPCLLFTFCSSRTLCS